MSGLCVKSAKRWAKRRTKQAQNDACISFVLQGGVRPKVKVPCFVTSARRNNAIRCYFVITFFPFMMLIPFAVLTRLPSNVYIWFVPSLMLPYYIWFQLSKGQWLRHFKAKTKGAEDSEEHTCTWLHAAILYARDIRLIGSHTLSQFLLGDFLALTSITDNLPHAIGVSLLTECLALWCSHLSVALAGSWGQVV